MTNYWDPRFTKHFDKPPQVIFEVGARYGDESIVLSNKFPHATIYSFECNPKTVEMCRKKLDGCPKIRFFAMGLGEEKTSLPFYSYIQGNDGASSFYQRVDASSTQKMTGVVEMDTLENVMHTHHIETIDLLCMDVQGFELNILKGAKERLKNIRYIIMEQPKLCKGDGDYSKYLEAPGSGEIKDFMTSHGFIEIARLWENDYEDNVMYCRS